MAGPETEAIIRPRRRVAVRMAIPARRHVAILLSRLGEAEVKAVIGCLEANAARLDPEADGLKCLVNRLEGG